MIYNKILVRIFPSAFCMINKFFCYRKILLMFSLIIYFSYVVYMRILPIYLIGLAGVFYCLIYLSYSKHNFILDETVIIVSLIFYFCLQSHLFPLVNNVLLAKNILIGKEGVPWNLYVNYDKALMFFIIFFVKYNQSKDYKVNYKYCMMVMILGVISIVFLSLKAGFIRYDFKIDPVLWPWGLNNLLMVCVPEEIFFRLFLYKMFIKINVLNKYSSWLPLFVSSLLFGMFHYAGGIIYVLLAFCAGILYCLLYVYSGKIQISILGHFMLNLIHFIFFSYPRAL